MQRVICGFALVFVALSARAETPPGAVKLAVVKAEGGTLVVHDVVTAFETRSEIREVVAANGQKQQVTVTFTVPVQRTVSVTYDLKNVTAHDLDGLKVDPEKLPDLLKKAVAVVISPTGKIDAAFKAALKDGTLILTTPAAAPAPPRIPAPAPPKP